MKHKLFPSFIAILLLLPLSQAQAKLQLNQENFLYEKDPKALASTLQVTFKTGSLSDPKGKEGLARIAFLSLLRGTQSKTRVEFFNALERLGANISVDTASSRTIIGLDSISDNLEESTSLLAEAVLNPGLRKEDFKNLIEEELAKLNEEKANNRALLRRTIRQALFANTPLAFPPEGTIESIQNITLEDVKQFLKQTIKSKNIIFAASANLTQASVKALLENSFDIPEGSAPVSPKVKIQTPKGRNLFLVDRKGSSTTEMAIAQSGINASNPDREALETGMFIFGSDFTSRLPTVLRKENGWTYGAYASFQMVEPPRSYGGTFMIYAFPQSQYTEKATLKAIEMYEDYTKNGITNKELRFAQQSLINSYPFSLATSRTRLTRRLYNKLDGAPLRTVAEYKKIVGGLNTKNLSKVIKKVHTPNNLVIVLIGDPEQTAALAKSIPNLKSVRKIDDPMKAFKDEE